MKRILLIGPDTDFGVVPYEGIVKTPSLKKKALMVPLHIATVSALTPDDIEVDLWDEPIHGRIDESTKLKNYDLVGITGYVVHHRRVKEIARVFRNRGIPVAIGGAGVSSAPELYRDAFDILFIGEAEYTWPQFIADWKAGSYRSEYRQISKPKFTDSPYPRWDGLSVHMQKYTLGAVQTTRGCPFDCEFCDVIYLFGRRSRNKPIDQVLEEVCRLERLNKDRIFFCDDNFIGNHCYTKELLKELVSLNRTFRNPIQFGTQLTINVARDEKLLELLADANFGQVFIGIESPNKESLKETGKSQNYRSNLVEDLKKIMSYGIAIKGAMIVGFDHDTPEIFDQQFEFLQEACIPIVSINLLKAPEGTRLWARLRKERRLLADYNRHHSENLRAGTTNIIPKRMSRVELFSGYLSLLERLNEWHNFEARVKGFISGIKRQPNAPQKRVSDQSLSSILNTFSASMDKKTQHAISNILSHVRQHAPFMLKKVIWLLIMQYSELVIMQPIREELQKQIELEKSGAVNLEVDQSDILVPENFKEPYRNIFPEIYKYIYSGLTDKTRTEEALVEVFTDFLVRWSQTFEGFKDYHRIFLLEIADRTISKENKEFSLPGKEYQKVPDVKETRLADEILKAIEQELRNVRFDEI